MALELTDANFEELVMNSDKPVLVDFWAVWCGPCRMVGPVVDEISNDYEGRAIVGKVDVDNNPEVAQKYGIRNIPTILFLKNGEIVDKQVGAVQKATLAEKLDAMM
ncbi:MAG: thioredoxin [Flavobacteriales bacterium]|nr:MAG: thioredoxin [Flavobacteriales bacterium]